MIEHSVVSYMGNIWDKSAAGADAKRSKLPMLTTVYRYLVGALKFGVSKPGLTNDDHRGRVIDGGQSFRAIAGNRPSTKQAVREFVRAERVWRCAFCAEGLWEQRSLATVVDVGSWSAAHSGDRRMARLVR